MTDKVNKKPFFIYVLLTKNNTFYCGYTDDVGKRFEKHLNGTGAKYTRANKPVKVVYQKQFCTKSEAMKAEKKFKKLPKAKKQAIIDGYLTFDEL